MKRKIALLLASLMVLSMVPMNTFAASSNRLSLYPTNVPRYTSLLEQGWANSQYERYVPSYDEIYKHLDTEEREALAKVAAHTTNLATEHMRQITPFNAKIVETSNYSAFASAIGSFTTTKSNTWVTASSQALGKKINAYYDGLRGKNVGRSLVTLTDSGDMRYVVDGGNFSMKLDSAVRAGDSFVIELTNAEWFFRQDGATVGNYNDAAVSGGGTALDTVKDNLMTRIDALRFSSARGISSAHLDSDSLVNATHNYNRTDSIANLPRTNYDLGLGWYYPNTNKDGRSGVYYRYGSTDGDPSLDTYISANELAYALVISDIDYKRATITILEDGSRDDGIVIPVMIRATETTSDVILTLKEASITGVFNTGTWKLTGTSGTATEAKATDTVVHNNTFTFGLNLRESRLGSIVTNHAGDGRYSSLKTGYDTSSTIQLVAPTGFHWDRIDSITVGLEYGLLWGRTGEAGAGTKATKIDRDELYGTATGSVLIDPTSGDFYVEYKRTYDGYQYDDTILEITLSDIQKSTDVLGTLYLRELRLYSDTSITTTGDVLIDIRNKDDSNRPVIAEITGLKVGERKNYGASLTIGTVPELVAGRYEVDQTNGVALGMLNASDAYHKAASVKWQENVYASWWSGREILFTLADGAKFRKVEFTATDKLGTNTLRNTVHYTTIYTQDKINAAQVDTQITLPTSVYINDGIRHGNVTVNESTMTVINLTPSNNTDARMTFTFIPWLSLEVGHGSGDVEITVSGAAGYSEETQTAVIAKRIEPVEVTTTITDLKIGYQYQTTADIEIKETKAGNLLRNKDIYVSVNDMISMDMQITNDAVVNIVEGNIKLGRTSVYGNGNTTRISGNMFGSLGSTSSNGGTIVIPIERASTEASTIKISNVAVKVDRTVPETNDRPYKVIVWGSAIAENYGNERDKFGLSNKSTGIGVVADYVQVVSAAPEKAGVLTQEVRVSIGESYVLVNGTPEDMDAAAYISPASNSTMVPVRFVAYALGLTTDQIIWDGINKTVTLMHPTKVIQFTSNSSNMVISGVNVGMISPDGLPVYAEINGADGHERMYIPFRALGDAFGVSVTWDATTQTAIYNEKAE